MNAKDKARLLKAAIKEREIKYRGVEKRTGIPATTLQQYCSGRPIPDEKLLLICEKLGIDSKIFGLTVRDFVHGEAV